MDAYAKIKDDETASKALSLRNRLNELSRDADKKRDELKRPHLEAGKAIDGKWQPLVKSAKAGADKVKDAISGWETEKLRAQREAERKAYEAEQARIAAERATQKDDGETAVIDSPKVEVAPAAAQSTVRATYGKAASVQAKTFLKDVTDWPALAVYMSNHPEMQDLLRKLAQRAIDAGRADVPGITTEERASVR